MSLLGPEEISDFVQTHPEWSWSDQSISRTFQFDDFAGSIAFVNQVAEIAEEANHHPDIDIRWNQVSITLSTHSEGGLTHKDLAQADRISSLV
jgi:4a-hydroxytetrahydrobiopterin dehydratase